ncbi:hypothetical protein AB0O77_32995, partial [Streptomyces albidoflavus]
MGGVVAAARPGRGRADYGALINDVFSYQKEVEFEGEIHNAVLVTQN